MQVGRIKDWHRRVFCADEQIDLGAAEQDAIGATFCEIGA
jgi:hypothetical protein